MAEWGKAPVWCLSVCLSVPSFFVMLTQYAATVRSGPAAARGPIHLKDYGSIDMG